MRKQAIRQIQVAHQVEDRAAARAILIAQAVATLDWKLPLVEEPLVLARPGQVLHQAARHIPNGARRAEIICVAARRPRVRIRVATRSR
jgi:hypothetical protein